MEPIEPKKAEAQKEIEKEPENAPENEPENESSAVENENTNSSISTGCRCEDEISYHLRFHNAISADNIEQLKQLLSQSTAKNIICKKNIGRMDVLQFAIYHGNLEIVKILSQMEYSEPPQTNFNTPLIHIPLIKAAIPANREKYIQIFLYLLQVPTISITAVDAMKRSALHIAALYNLYEVVNPLAAKGFKLQEEDLYGYKAVHLAIENKHYQFVDALFDEYGSEFLSILTPIKENLIAWAIKKSAWSCLYIILKNATLDLIDLPSPNGENPKAIASSNNSDAKLKAVLEAVEKEGEYDPHILDDYNKVLVISDVNCHKHALIPIDVEAQFIQKKRQPENDERLRVLLGDNGILQTANIHLHCSTISNVLPANISDILRIHDYSYISEIISKCSKLPISASVLPTQYDKDTFISSESYTVATYAAGAVIKAVDSVAQGEYKYAFCPIRPPGHHIGPYGPDGLKELRTTGFCLLNNVAMGASYAKYNYKSKFNRIAIVDFDVHHGNGTEAMVRNLTPNTITDKLQWVLGKIKIEKMDYKPWLNDNDASNVLFISIHGYNKEHPVLFYPSTGSDSDNTPGESSIYPGGVMNVPMALNATNEEWIKQFSRYYSSNLISYSYQQVLTRT